MQLRTIAALLLGSAALVLFAPLPAFATGGGSSGASITVVVVLILSVGAAYLLTNYFVDWLSRRFLVAPGVEFLVVGALLGPGFVGVFSDITGILPIVALAAGWVGLLRGMEINRKRIGTGPTGALRLAIGDALVSGGLVGGAVFVAYSYGLVGPLHAREVWLSAGVLGCCAAAGAAPAELLGQRYELRKDIVPLLERTARLGDVIAVFAFGLVFCFFHHEGAATEAGETARAALPLSPWQWTLVALLLGTVLGLFFRPFIGEQGDDNDRFLALVGIITFASGAAYFLSLSPLLVNLMLGAALVNTATNARQIQGALERTERPMALLLLVLAGALLRLPPLVPTLVTTALFIAMRVVGKRAGCLLFALGSPLRKDLGRGLLAHGDVTLAMAISFRLVYHGTFADVAYASVLASVVIHNLIAPRILRSLLVDGGQIVRERAETVPEKAATTP